MEIKEQKEEKELKIDMEKQSKMINKILIFLIIVIIVATVLLVIYQKERYNDYYFEYNDFPIHKVRQGNIDVYQIEVISGDKKVLLTARYDPRDLEEIYFEDCVLANAFNKQEIFITMPSNATGVSVLAATEIGKITGNPYILKEPIPTHGALVADIEGKNITVKTCNDVNYKTAVIELRHGNENKIYCEGQCVILEGISEYDFVKLVNRLTLGLIGIIR